MKLIVATLLVTLGLSGCKFQEQADEKFGDQHFKTAVALIELHRTRFGSYPESLADLKFIGEWDKLALSSVEYKRAGRGYELNITRGWVGKPTLHFPDQFWQGLGIRRSNVEMPGKTQQSIVPNEDASAL